MSVGGGTAAAEAVRKFAALVDSSGVLKKLEIATGVLKGPLKVCREKLATLESEEAVEVLHRIDPNYCDQLIKNVEDIYGEEVETGKCVIEDVDTSLSELQSLLETISHKLEDEYRKEGTVRSSHTVLTAYDDCTSILTFLRLKTNILRNHLNIPFYEKANSDPFKDCPEFISDEEENCYYLMSKLVAVHL